MPAFRDEDPGVLMVPIVLILVGSSLCGWDYKTAGAILIALGCVFFVVKKLFF